jgi:hypothetical protein
MAAQYHRITLPELGELPFFANLGALAEFEDFYGKPWHYLLSATYATKAIWFTLLFKCYETACKRLKQEVKYTAKDFQLYFTGEQYKEIVALVEKDLMDELGINLEEIQKKTIESLK